jgi:hypothetical protein
MHLKNHEKQWCVLSLFCCVADVFPVQSGVGTGEEEAEVVGIF